MTAPATHGECQKGNLVAGASAKTPILHKDLPIHMQAVLQKVAIAGKELDDAVALLNKTNMYLLAPMVKSVVPMLVMAT